MRRVRQVVRHVADRRSDERSQGRAADAPGAAALHRLASAIARTRQDNSQLLFEHRLDEAAHMSANAVLDGVAPIIEK